MFDIDANGILNVTAKDTGTGKSSKITITNEKGRLSQKDIDKMVREAEQYKAEDDERKKTVEAKNVLENLCYQFRNSIDDENIKDKIPAEDREKVESTVKDTLAWLDRNQLATEEEFKHKTKDLEAVVHPIMRRVYESAGGGAGMPEGMPSTGGQRGTHVEEVD